MERTTRGRPKGSRGGRGKGKRGRKPRVVVSDTEESNEIETNAPELEEDKTAEPETDNTTDTPAAEAVGDVAMDTKETDMSQLEPLETPSFTTMTRNVPQVMLRLNWDHKVNLIGEKVLNPMIYCCDQCEKPILIYGRMIQCKHVFCLTCARTEAVLKICPRCKEKVVRVEQTGLGTVFMCTHGGTRYGKDGCRRTYLSQRDLQAHINHRHVMAPAPQDIKTTEKSSATTAIPQNPTHQQNSHLRKDSMVQPPPAMPHPVKQPFNSSVFQSAPPQSAANKMSHHSQDMHGFYNNQQSNYSSGHQFGNNGAGSSTGNNFYQPFNNSGHYSQQGGSQPQQHHFNQQQQYFR